MPTCGVLWGTYPDSAAADAVAATSAAEQVAGQALDVVRQYHDFSGSGDHGRLPTKEETLLIGSGHVLHFGWSTSLWGRDPDHVSWRSIAEGQHDDVIDAQARRLVAMERAAPGRQYFIDFDHEPDSRHNNGSADDYVAAARRVHNRMVTAGGHDRRLGMGHPERRRRRRAVLPGRRRRGLDRVDPHNRVRCDDHRDPWLSFAGTVTPT